MWSIVGGINIRNNTIYIGAHSFENWFTIEYQTLVSKMWCLLNRVVFKQDLNVEILIDAYVSSI